MCENVLEKNVLFNVRDYCYSYYMIYELMRIK